MTPNSAEESFAGKPGWPRYPLIYEINTWVWLADLSRKRNRRVHLGTVDSADWDAIASLRFDAVWLMGVWERSPAGIAVANSNPELLADFARALPDYRPEDNVGSPYCIRIYSAADQLGGPEGLASARKALARRGVKLILDFVPNHVAPDHPWTREHPEYFIRGTKDDLREQPSAFLESNGNIYARGKDPYFPPWPDVLQLNAFAPGLRQAALQTISDIAGQCDGIRCDMAMLVMNVVFERTWGVRAGRQPAADFWTDLIPDIKSISPGFLFIAEAYWNLEWQLRAQGFDFCYDKTLYDRLASADAEAVRDHLRAGLDFQAGTLRFLENHDEPRAAVAFGDLQQRAAAVTVATVPGAKLFYEGQLEGRKVKSSVFLGRRPEEPWDASLTAFYRALLEAVDRPVFRDGDWVLCEITGWPENSSSRNLLAWCWSKDSDRYLIVVNLSGRAAQGRVLVPWLDGKEKSWLLHDVLSGESYRRDGEEMQSQGLYVDLGAWSYHFFSVALLETA